MFPPFNRRVYTTSDLIEMRVDARPHPSRKYCPVLNIANIIPMVATSKPGRLLCYLSRGTEERQSRKVAHEASRRRRLMRHAIRRRRTRRVARRVKRVTCWFLLNSSNRNRNSITGSSLLRNLYKPVQSTFLSPAASTSNSTSHSGSSLASGSSSTATSRPST